MRLCTPRTAAGLASGFALIMSLPSAQAQTTDRSDTVTVAVGGALSPSYTGSDDYRIRPGVILRARVSGHAITTRGTFITVDALPKSGHERTEWSLGPAAGVRLNRTGRIGDAQVRALGKLDPAWEIGGWIGVTRRGVLTSEEDSLSLRVSALADTGGAHRSYTVTPTIEYAMPVSRGTLIGLNLSADYVGRGYGRYYFDVSPSGSQASGLAPYADGGKAGFMRVSGGLLVAQSLSGDLRKGWALVAGGTYGHLFGRYADSPIVADAGDRNQWLGGLGVAYSF